jgi:hypothetical protein
MVSTRVGLIYGFIYLRKPWYNNEGGNNISAISGMTGPNRSQNFRRIAVLNKLFMRHITDMMASGEVANEIRGQGVEISRVCV